MPRRAKPPRKIVTDRAAYRKKEGDKTKYALEPSGIPATATGRVFVRFAEHVDAASRTNDIASAGFKIVLADTGEQLIGTPVETPANGVDIVTLGVDDVPAMIELTTLTKPGPFYARTHELGTFLGIRVDGQLVAMAGERMKPAEYTEITAVCVHPSHRGRGYGQMLLSAVSRQIVSRGEIPFLHVFTNNHQAIALYRRQGMEIRRRLHVTVLKKED